MAVASARRRRLGRPPQVARRPSPSYLFPSGALGKRLLSDNDQSFGVVVEAVGPSSRVEAMKITESMLQRLDDDLLSSLIGKVVRGVRLYTDYSGCGQPEHVMKRVETWSKAHGYQPSIIIDRCSDILPHCRTILTASTPAETCVLGDMTKRLPEDLLDEIEDAMSRHRALLQKTLLEAKQSRESQRKRTPPKATLRREHEVAFLKEVLGMLRKNEVDSGSCQCLAWCYKHGRMCPSIPNPSGSEILIGAGGISCLDWSVRGLQGGTLGKGCLAFCTFMREARIIQPDILFCECTRLYPHEDIMLMLGDLYDLHEATFSPSLLGIPAERWRKYMVCIKKQGRVKWAADRKLTFARLKSMFGQTLQCDGHVFLESTPDKMIYKKVQKDVATRHLASRDVYGGRWRPRDLLTAKTRQRLEIYEDVINSSRGDNEELKPFLCDITQDLGYGSITSNVPALMRSGGLWSLLLDRPVLPEEKLEIMGIPCIDCEATLGLPMPWGANTLKKLRPKQ